MALLLGTPAQHREVNQDSWPGVKGVTESEANDEVRQIFEEQKK